MNEKKGNLKELLGDFTLPEPDPVREWEDEVRPDSEWAVATATQPLHPQHTGQAESTGPVWDGPLRVEPETPETVFDRTFDQEELDAAIRRAPEFQQISGRFNPFDLSRMREMLEGSHYSAFLKRSIITFKDALDHSIQLCLFWAEEDESAEAAKQKEVEWTPPPEDEQKALKKAERVEKARQEWKDAIAHKKEVIAEQEAIVAEKRMRYQYEKNRRQ